MTYLNAASSGRAFMISPWLLLMPPLATLVNVFSDSFSPNDLVPSPYFAAFADSLTHSVTGVLLTIAIFVHRRPFRPLLITSCLCSTLIDVDHFISAGSLSLYSATHIPGGGRPFLHDTVTVAALCIVVILICEFVHYWRTHSSSSSSSGRHRKSNTWGEALIASGGAENVGVRGRCYVPFVITLCVSLLAHHSRDALRRGFWLKPVSTRAISYPEMTLIFYALVFVGKFFADRTTHAPRRSVFTV